MFDVIGQTVKAFSQIRLGPWQNLGDTLLVGEGNLSFAKSLLSQPAAQITHMTATTYEKERNLSDEAQQNASLLQRYGALVMHGVDATHLERSFRPYEFDTIIFQFPNVGSRKAKYGQNPDHIMIRKFLHSAERIFKPDGKVLITAVDSPHYQGVFRFDDAAKFAGYEITETWPFDPSLFSGYAHTNTNDEDSALDGHSRFVTHVFGIKT
mgnify:CR=1 FL=1